MNQGPGGSDPEALVVLDEDVTQVDEGEDVDVWLLDEVA